MTGTIIRLGLGMNCFELKRQAIQPWLRRIANWRRFTGANCSNWSRCRKLRRRKGFRAFRPIALASRHFQYFRRVPWHLDLAPCLQDASVGAVKHRLERPSVESRVAIAGECDQLIDR